MKHALAIIPVILLLVSTAGADLPPVTTGLISHWDAGDITGLNPGDTVNTWINTGGGPNATLSNGTPTYETDASHGLPTVRFNSAASNPGEYFSFTRLTNIRTVFWVINDNSPTRQDHFLMGDNSTYHFHRGDSGQIWHSGYAHANIRNGTTKLNGTAVNGTSTVLPEGADVWHIISVRTTGNVAANQLFQDRTYHGSWEGDVAEMIVYSSALSDADEETVGYYLETKYGLDTAYVPEPATLALLSAGGLGLVLRRRRK